MSAEALSPILVTDPGVYPSIPEQNYHADPTPAGSLSVSGAKKLLPPSCPARFKWERDNGQKPKDVFDFGSAAHALVLGVGRDLVEVNADDWRTNAAKETRDEARARGAAPLLSKDMRVVEDMAKALHAHPIASALLSRSGVPEASLFWQDPFTDTTLRCRFDFLPDASEGRMLASDYKTAASANPEKFGKAAADYCYDMQAAWYLDGILALELHDDPAFLFIVQEKDAPYLVSVVELDSEALIRGRNRNRQAIDLYAECVATDTWPGYCDDVALVSLPRWAA